MTELVYKKARKSRIDLTGKRFGKLTVLEYAGTGKGGAFWKCKCDCGKIKTILSHSLRSGRTTSCGCYNIEATSKRYCDILKRVERLQEQLNEAQNLIIYTANGHDHLFAQIKCEDYMHKYHLPKWGVK